LIELESPSAGFEDRPHRDILGNVDQTSSSLAADQFVQLVRANPINAALLTRLKALALPQCHLVAGCLFQTVWNYRSGANLTAQIKDYDVFYFDNADLSWEAEDEVIRRVNATCADLGAVIEAKNQARVHLWYEKKFGAPCPALTAATNGIDRFLAAGLCLGIEAATGHLYAPGGVDEAWRGILRINQRNPIPDQFLEKARDYRRRWPWLTIVEP
jgi:hypothetical protein